MLDTSGATKLLGSPLRRTIFPPPSQRSRSFRLSPGWASLPQILVESFSAFDDPFHCVHGHPADEGDCTLVRENLLTMQGPDVAGEFFPRPEAACRQCAKLAAQGGVLPDQRTSRPLR